MNVLLAILDKLLLPPPDPPPACPRDVDQGAALRTRLEVDRVRDELAEQDARVTFAEMQMRIRAWPFDADREGEA